MSREKWSRAMLLFTIVVWYKGQIVISISSQMD